MDAIQVVKRDHRAIEALFKEFERADKAESKADMKRIVRGIVKELSVHAAIEEQVLYPALREAEEDVEDDVLEALEEHHVAKLTLAELDTMSPKAERYAAKVTVLMESVRHHIEEEEQELLPRLKSAMSPTQLRDLGGLLETAKKAAPTRPHPAAPDEPPGNLFAGPVAAVLDRGRDALRGLASAGRERSEKVLRRGRGAVEEAAARGRRAAARGGSRAKGAISRRRGTASGADTHG